MESLPGKDGILLDGFESSGFWGTRVLLNLGPQPANEPRSTTSRVANWAGGIDILDRGEPVSIPVRSADEMFAPVTKAAAGNAQRSTARHSNLRRGGRQFIKTPVKRSPYNTKNCI